MILKTRKGIFFTIMAITLVSIVILTYTAMYSYSLHEKASIIETRVDTMNLFLSSVEVDMLKAIYISGHRSVVGVTEHVTNNGTYVSNTTETLKELFLNGTIDGDQSLFLLNNTFQNWIEKISEKGLQLDINMSIDIQNISINQISPWLIRFQVNSYINITDKKSTANWNKEKNSYYDISIIGFEDPAYALHTNGIVVKLINRTIYDNNFTVNNDTSNLETHLSETMYIAFNASPSFLMRFENTYNSSIYGIESLVNKTEILNYCALTTSSVDTICWQKNYSIPTWRVTGMNNTNFKIDNQTNDAGISRIQRYGLENVTY